MKDKQIMDLKAMESFKNNLFEKKVGGLRTSLNASPKNTYRVEWNASHLDLGSIYGPGMNNDVYCTMQVHDIYADALHLCAGSSSSYPSVRDELDSLSSRLDALGFRKAPSFGHGAVSQYVGDYRKAFEGSSALYPDYKVGWGTFGYISNAQMFPSEPKNDFSLMRIGKIAIVRGSAWYRFKDYSGNTPSPELLLKVSIPEGFRMVSGGMKCLAFSAFIQPGGDGSSSTPGQFPSEDCFVFDYGIDGLSRLPGVAIGEPVTTTQSTIAGHADSSGRVDSFWLRCMTGPTTANYQSIRLSLNGWWQCEEGMPEPTE